MTHKHVTSILLYFESCRRVVGIIKYYCHLKGILTPVLHHQEYYRPYPVLIASQFMQYSYESPFNFLFQPFFFQLLYFKSHLCKFTIFLRVEFFVAQYMVNCSLTYIVMSSVFPCAVSLVFIMVVFNDISSSKSHYFDDINCTISPLGFSFLPSVNGCLGLYSAVFFLHLSH